MTLLLVVDDHPLFRDGIAHMARAFRPEWSFLFAADAAEALRWLDTIRPDAVIIDVGLPGVDGFALLKVIADRAAAIPPILISGREDAAIRLRAQACGAHAFVAKTATPDILMSTIDAVLRGETLFPAAAAASLPVLTVRQIEVLMLLADGHGNKEIRHRLGIAERTVRAHLTDLFHLLGAHSRAQALLRAREFGLIA